jgi:hypothetical protein
VQIEGKGVHPHMPAKADEKLEKTHGVFWRVEGSLAWQNLACAWGKAIEVSCSKIQRRIEAEKEKAARLEAGSSEPCAQIR